MASPLSILAAAPAPPPATPTPAEAVPELLQWTGALVDWSVDLAIAGMIAGMLLCIVRLLRGPHLADRALAVDTLGIQLIGLVILLSIRLGTLMFFDGVLVLSLLSFAGTVAMGQYIARPHLRKRRAAAAKEATR